MMLRTLEQEMKFLLAYKTAEIEVKKFLYGRTYTFLNTLFRFISSGNFSNAKFLQTLFWEPIQSGSLTCSDIFLYKLIKSG